ncbi:MAG: hypothetical protein R2688_04490 [Fimbriimonadaceae bacterium]
MFHALTIQNVLDECPWPSTKKTGCDRLCSEFNGNTAEVDALASSVGLHGLNAVGVMV